MASCATVLPPDKRLITVERYCSQSLLLLIDVPVPIQSTSLHSAATTTLGQHSSAMSSVRLFYVAARTKPSSLLRNAYSTRPTGRLSAKRATLSKCNAFSTTAVRAAVDPHDPHHEESFEEFSARSVTLIGEIAEPQWRIGRLPSQLALAAFPCCSAVQDF